MEVKMTTLVQILTAPDALLLKAQPKVLAVHPSHHQEYVDATKNKLGWLG